MLGLDGQVLAHHGRMDWGNLSGHLIYSRSVSRSAARSGLPAAAIARAPRSAPTVYYLCDENTACRNRTPSLRGPATGDLPGARAAAALGHDNTIVCPPESGIDSAARRRRYRFATCSAPETSTCRSPIGSRSTLASPGPTSCTATADAARTSSADWRPVSRTCPPSSRGVSTTPRCACWPRMRYRPFKKVIAISDAIADVCAIAASRTNA